MINDNDIPRLADKLIPHLAKRKWQTGVASQSPGGVGAATHALYGPQHTGTLDRSQAPWVSSDIAAAIAAHNTTGDPHTQYVHIANARTITASHNFAHATVGFTSPDADSYFVLGRALVGHDGFHGDDATFSHRDYAYSDSYALRQEGANGDVFLNAPLRVNHRIADVDLLRMSDGLVEIANVSSADIRTENYASQTTGWAITYEGALDVRYLYADEMHVKAFIADLEQALAGGQIICKSVAKLAVDFIVPAYSATTLITVESFPGFPNAYVFTTGDTIGIKIISRTNGTAGTPGSLAIGWLFGTASSPSINATDKTQTWILTRLSSSLINGFAAGGTASAGTTVEAGAIVLDFGVSGNGYYEVNAIDGQMAVNSPYSQVVTWAAHPIYDRTVRTREGNLTGLGFSGQYGLFARGADANQYIVASGSGITARNATISQYDGSNNLRGQWDTLSGIDLKALGDVNWGLTAGLHDMSISALQNYSFSDSGTIYGGVAGGKGSTRDRVVLYNQQYDVNKEAHVIVDARFIDSNNPNTYDRAARVTIATSRWFPGMGVQHNAYIELVSTSGNADTISLVADTATATVTGFGIGVTPIATLDVTRGSLGSGTAVFRGTTINSHFNFSTAEDTYLRGGKSTSKVIINDSTSGNVEIAGGGGNVGVGTSSPGAKLDINGSINASGAVGGSWSTPTYGTNWTDFGGGYGGIRYRKFGDVVMMEGLAVNAGGAGGAVVATLPSGYRPAESRVFAAYSHYGVIRLDINTDGTVTTPGTSFSGSWQWVSLNGTTFHTS
jgi:hypothetical protein